MDLPLSKWGFDNQQESYYKAKDKVLGEVLGHLIMRFLLIRIKHSPTQGDSLTTVLHMNFVTRVML